jgi:hypothetical protein
MRHCHAVAPAGNEELPGSLLPSRSYLGRLPYGRRGRRRCESGIGAVLEGPRRGIECGLDVASGEMVAERLRGCQPGPGERDAVQSRPCVLRERAAHQVRERGWIERNRPVLCVRKQASGFERPERVHIGGRFEFA